MRAAAVIAIAILMGGLSAVAQTAVPAQDTPMLRPSGAATVCTTTVNPDASGTQGQGGAVTLCRASLVPACPIDMHVRHGVGGAKVAVNQNGEKREVLAPRLRLFLNDLRTDKSGRRIVSATVTIHGANGKARLQPTDAFTSGPGEMETTLTVALAEWGDPGVSGDFRLPGFVTASRVDLESVTYEDGSTWKLSGTEACRVAPDRLMRVGN
jgi:hypothetical protein